MLKKVIGIGILSLVLVFLGPLALKHAQLDLHLVATKTLKHWSPSVGDLVLIGGTVLLALIWWDQVKRLFKSGPSTAHGSAHWARGQELNVYTASSKECALVLGHAGRTQIALSEKRQQEHVLITGTTGKGKGVNVLVPGILRENGTRSLFIIDPKHEQVRLTAGAVAERHTLWVVAPDDPVHSVGYNPLAFIDTFEDAVDFARCWVENTGWASEPFWNNLAVQVLAGAALHLRATEADPPLSRLADLLVSMPFEALYEQFLGSPSRPVREAIAPQLASLHQDKRLAGSAMTGIANHLFLLQSEAVRWVTSHNTLDFTQMVQEPTALYLAIPADAAERLKPLSACLMTQMFSAWLRLAARSPNGRLTRQMVCYLDEFGNAGILPGMSQRITMLRSVNVALVLAVQNFAQLIAYYGLEGAKTIRDNASTQVVLRGIGQDEAEFYSRRIGASTVRTRTKHATATGTGYGEQESARPLITPDEIRTMPERRMLVIADVAAPVRVQVTPYYRDKRLAARAGLPVPLPIRAIPDEEATIDADVSPPAAAAADSEGAALALPPPRPPVPEAPEPTYP